jgi:5S rRNA maturation endonuclease (ribonuclease M5)/energy-coupling factor transporter ATP-binding protein EcfA2
MEVSHQPCPFCPSSDAFSYRSDSGLFRCFSCGADSGNKKGFVFDGGTLEPFTPKAIEEGIYLEPYIPDNYRGISKKVMEKHGVYFTKMEDKETVHYTYPNGTKHRELPKQIKISGKVDKFYGQDDYTSGKNITITEGEEDRLSVIEMMGDWPAVSVPGATPSKDFWENARRYLQNFEKIVLSVDSDEPGDKLALKFYQMFPGKVYRVNHGNYKDANDFLKDGAEAEYKRSWWSANKVKPDTILCTKEDFVNLFNNTPDYEYFPTGIDALDKKMLGIHKGAFTVILAKEGIGKTEVMRYLEWVLYTTTNYSFGYYHGEESQLRSILGLFSYHMQKAYIHKGVVIEDGVIQDYEDFVDSFTKDSRSYQFKFNLDDTVDDIVNQVRFLGTAMGVDYIFFEPIQDFVYGSTSDKENQLTDLTNKLKRLCVEINVGIVVIAHTNEDGEAKYCRSITQGAGYSIVLNRDSESEDPLEANTTYISVGRKNRTGGGSGPAGSLTFDKDTYMLTPDLGPQEPVFDHTETGKAIGF